MYRSTIQRDIKAQSQSKQLEEDSILII